MFSFQDKMVPHCIFACKMLARSHGKVWFVLKYDFVSITKAQCSYHCDKHKQIFNDTVMIDDENCCS